MPDLEYGYRYLQGAFGLRVVEVADLDPPVIYLRDHRIAFVSSDLDEACRLRVCERLFLAECGVPLHHA